MVEGGFELNLHNNTIIKTTNLTWGKSLPEFVDLVENKDKLPSALIESIPHFSGPGKLYISMEISDQNAELLKKTFSYLLAILMITDISLVSFLMLVVIKCWVSFFTF